MPSIFGMLDSSTSVEEEEVEQAVKKTSPTNKLKIAKTFHFSPYYFLNRKLAK